MALNAKRGVIRGCTWEGRAPISANLVRGASMGEWLLSRRDRLIVARHEVPGAGVWTFRGRISGRCAKCRQGDRRRGIQKINEAKQLGGLTHHVNGGMPGRQARS